MLRCLIHRDGRWNYGGQVIFDTVELCSMACMNWCHIDWHDRTIICLCRSLLQFFSDSQSRVYPCLLGQPERSYHLSELRRLTGLIGGPDSQDAGRRTGAADASRCSVGQKNQSKRLYAPGVRATQVRTRFVRQSCLVAAYFCVNWRCLVLSPMCKC